MKRLKLGMAALTTIAGTLFAIGFAAAQAAPSVSAGPDYISNGTYMFALNNEPTECITTNGVGNQLTIGNIKLVTCASITVTQVQSGIFTFQDASGHCLKADTSNVVYVANGACSTSDQGELWLQTNNNPQSRFQNFASDGWMKTDSTNPNSGAKVWTGTGGDNNWYLTNS